MATVLPHRLKGCLHRKMSGVNKLGHERHEGVSVGRQ